MTEFMFKIYSVCLNGHSACMYVVIVITSCLQLWLSQ